MHHRRTNPWLAQQAAPPPYATAYRYKTAEELSLLLMFTPLPPLSRARPTRDAACRYAWCLYYTRDPASFVHSATPPSVSLTAPIRPAGTFNTVTHAAYYVVSCLPCHKLWRPKPADGATRTAAPASMWPRNDHRNHVHNDATGHCRFQLRIPQAKPSHFPPSSAVSTEYESTNAGPCRTCTTRSNLLGHRGTVLACCVPRPRE